jgi:hypothetical protein
MLAKLAATKMPTRPQNCCKKYAKGRYNTTIRNNERMSVGFGLPNALKAALTFITML